MLRAAWSLLRWSVIGVVVILTAIVLFIRTESGSQHVVETIAAAMGERLHIRRVSGSLTGTLTLEGIDYLDDVAQISVERLSLSWLPAGLFDHTLFVTNLHASGVDVVLSASSSLDTETAPFELALPIKVVVQALRVEGVRVEREDTVIDIDALEFSAFADEHLVGVHNLFAQGPTWRASLSGSAAPVAPYSMRLRADWSMLVAQALNGGRLRVEGDANHLEFTTAVTAPFELHSTGELTRRGDAVAISASGEWGSLRWPLLGKSDYASEHGKFTLTGDLDDFRLALEGDFRSDAVPIEQFSVVNTGSLILADTLAFEMASEWGVRLTSQVSAAGLLTVNGDSLSVDFEHELRTPFVADMSGRFDRSSGVAHIAAQGVWQNAAWPLTGAPFVLSPAGKFDVQGALDALDVTLDVHFEPHGELDDLSISIESQVRTSPAVAFDSRFEWRALFAEEQVLLEGHGMAAGVLDGAISFSHDLSAPFAVSSIGSIALDGGQPVLDLTTRWTDLAWPPTTAAQLRSATGELSAQGWLNNFVAQLTAELDDTATPLRDIELKLVAGLDSSAAEPSFKAELDWLAGLADGTKLRGQGRAHGSVASVDLEHDLSAPFDIKTRGRVTLGDTPALDLNGMWVGLYWPLSAPVVYRSNHGVYTLRGPVDALHVNVTTDVAATNLPDVAAAVEGIIDPQGFDLTSTRLALLNGAVTSSGRVSWAPALSWALDVEASGLETGTQWPDWPGRLEGTVAVAGRLDEQGLRTTLDIAKLGGRLRGQPVSARGVVTVLDDRIEVRGLSLATGSNRLEIDGVYDKQAELSFMLAAPDLSEILPDLKGKVSASGTASGTLAAPTLVVELVGSDLSYQNNFATSLLLDANVSPSKMTNSRIDLRVEQATAGGQQFEMISITADGNVDSHDLDVSLESSAADAVLELTGAVHEGAWRGTLRQFGIETPSAGHWQLEAASDLFVDSDQLTLSETCLTSGAGGKACTALDWAVVLGNKHAEISISDLSLGLADPWLPNEAGLTGRLILTGDLNEQAGSLRGNFSVSISAGELGLPQAGRKKMVLSHDQTTAKIRIEGDKVSASFESLIGDAGQVSANVVLDNEQADGRLSGTVEATLPQLDIVTPFVTALDQVDGSLGVQATLGGTLSAPKINGRAVLKMNSGVVVPLGIEVTQAQAEVESDSRGSATLSGTVQSGGGQLSLTGSGLLDASAGFPLELMLDGEDFEIMRVPLAHVFASPALRVIVEREKITVVGTVLVPKATITPKDLSTGAVTVSADEIILDKEQSETKPAARSSKPVEIDVTIELGDEVVFDGFGLISRLAGKLAISQNAQGIVTGQGNLDLIGGQFNAYGQHLEIERGRLLFAGPLDNPGLDVRAVRKSGSVTAGILIGGTATSLSLKVFSEPALSEAEALSYLLTGRGLSGANSGEAALLSQAALSLGLKGASLITQQLQSTFGLDEVSVGGIGEAGHTSLILSKRLTPDITVRYAVGLFDTIGAFFLNYQLTENLSLETESGETQGVNLLYNIERESVLP